MMQIIDTHIHLWDTNVLNYPWLDSVPTIRQPFHIADYQQAVKSHPVEKIVFVQAECLPEQYLEEVAWVTAQAKVDARIQGIVAYAPLEKNRSLEALKANPLVKGVRRMYDDAPALCRTTSFLDAVNNLPNYNFSLDISIKPHAIPDTLAMIAACPDTLFILDHLGKPDIRSAARTPFEKDLDAFARYPNVVAKLSGLITEADWDNWNKETLAPYVQHALVAFGPARLMFGGDWPVLLLAGTWAQWLETLQEIIPTAYHQQIFYDNALKTYQLK